MRKGLWLPEHCGATGGSAGGYDGKYTTAKKGLQWVHQRRVVLDASGSLSQWQWESQFCIRGRVGKTGRQGVSGEVERTRRGAAGLLAGQPGAWSGAALLVGADVGVAWGADAGVAWGAGVWGVRLLA